MEATNNFWKFDTVYWYQTLSSSGNGLTQAEAEDRLKRSAQHRRHISSFQKDVLLFLGQFKSPLMLLLIGAVILSALLGDYSDVFIIFFIVLSTGIMSFFQERNAGKVVEKLESMIALKCSVLRDGKVQEILSSTIVSGDIIQFKAGDMIPADCLIIESNELHANEASLTGESYPVRKNAGVLTEITELSKRTNCLWEGSNIVSGTATAIVIATGKQTIFGSITQSVSKNSLTAFERVIKAFGFFLMRITLFLSLFILIVNLLNHKSAVDSALFALALAVGMAPELLPAITTIAMSAGAKRMLNKKVIVKKLASIQNLGEVNLFCTDKTGTITDGTISVSGLVDISGKESAYVKQLAYWNAISENGYANPIDDALRALKMDTNLVTPTKIGEIPYDFMRKRLSISIDTGSEKILICKGAFTQIESISNRVRLSDGTIEDISNHKAELEKQFEDFGINGYRAIGICYKTIQTATISVEDENEMIFAGFVLLQDPIKPGIIETINELKILSVDMKIITGDNKNVAKAIALKIGITDPVIMTGQELSETSTEALQRLVQDVHIFAEVEPQQKEHIIQTLRKTYTVAYMGDGINDVSAINAADVGISVENAVDVAREAADFVLMEKDLTVLIDGIKEGRKTFANTMKYIFINTGSTFGNMCSVAAASLLLPFLPMLPKQILLTNFITDFPFLAVASDNVDEEQVKKPGKWNLKSIRSYMLIFGIHSSVFDMITFSSLYLFFNAKETEFQTAWFVESVLTQLFIIFIIRTRKNFFKSVPGKYLFLLSVAGLIITIGLPYLPFAGILGFVPLPFFMISVMILIVLLYVITADLLKVWFFKKYKDI